MDYLAKTIEAPQETTVHRRIRQAVRRLGLTPRESQLVELFAMGYATAAVSKNLGISEATIRTHLRKIFSALKVASRVQLVALVLKIILEELDSTTARFTEGAHLVAVE